MKRLLIIICSCLLYIGLCSAKTKIYLERKQKNAQTRSLVTEPTANHEGNTIYLQSDVSIKELQVTVKDEKGNITEISGSDRLYESDSVIISISQGPRNRIVSTTQGLKVNDKGLLVADETGHTSRPGIFASGDVVNGARTVVEAVAHSKIVAESMHQYMQSLPVK